MRPGVVEAWTVVVASMALVLLAALLRTGRLRPAVLASLLWGKIAAGVLWIVGADTPVLYVYTVHDSTVSPAMTVSAAELILLSFLASFIVAWQWPRLSKGLGLPDTGVD